MPTKYYVTQEQLVQLSRIYNTMMTIETKGENTLVMGDCLRALQQSVQDIQQAPVAENAISSPMDD